MKALIADGVKLVVLGRDERVADLPEYAAFSQIKGFDALSRTLEYGPESKLLIVGEENVLADPRQPGAGDQHLVRVLAKAVYHVAGQRPVDPNWENRGRNVQQYELRVRRLDERFDARLKDVFQKATAAGKWQGTSAIHDPVAYWAAGVLAYFDALGQDDAPSDAPHPIATRELLRDYDPDLFALVHETMAYHGKVDWRFIPAGR